MTARQEHLLFIISHLSIIKLSTSSPSSYDIMKGTTRKLAEQCLGRHTQDKADR